MKKHFRNHLQYYWWLYIVSAVIIAAVWVSAFFIMDKASNQEKLDVTYIGNGLNTNALKTDLEEVLPNLSKQKIKELNVSARSDATSYEVAALLQTSPFGEYDLIIIKGEAIEKHNIAISSYFAEIPSDFVAKHFPDATLYQIDDKCYGIKTGEAFTRFVSGTEDSYIFFASGSVNAGGLTGRGYDYNDIALKAAIYLSGAAV